jgi:hypothetical protein
VLILINSQLNSTMLLPTLLAAATLASAAPAPGGPVTLHLQSARGLHKRAEGSP